MLYSFDEKAIVEGFGSKATQLAPDLIRFLIYLHSMTKMNSNSISLLSNITNDSQRKAYSLVGLVSLGLFFIITSNALTLFFFCHSGSLYIFYGLFCSINSSCFVLNFCLIPLKKRVTSLDSR